MRPVALYVHVPFCNRVCPYCAFNVTARFDGRSSDAFVASVASELAHLEPASRPALETVYVGGGTPTALDADALHRLLSAIVTACDVSSVREWTVEANPETVDAARAAAMRDAGVTRVSLGAQSMNDRLLRRLGRTHTASDVRRATDVLRSAGFTDLNVDLIYAQPGQTLSQWDEDLDAVIDLEPSHLSLYELTYEAGTPFGRGEARGGITRTEDELVVAMFHSAREKLSRAGIEWYEVSNFARPGRESLHNQVYWRNEPYWGVGPGAFGCVGSVRTTNASDVADWAARVASTGSGVETRQPLSNRDTVVETLAAGLRTRAGVDLRVLEARTGIDVLETHGTWIARLEADGLASTSGGRLRLSIDGVLVLDSLLLGFLDADAAPSAARR